MKSDGSSFAIPVSTYQPQPVGPALPLGVLTYVSVRKPRADDAKWEQSLRNSKEG